MEFRARVGLVFVLIGCFLGGMVILDMVGDTLFPTSLGQTELVPGVFTDQVFTKAGFLYGPQPWRPSYNPLGIDPGQDVLDNESWFLMFIDANTTPVSGNPMVKRLGIVRVTYNFTSLSGRAVFHVYGLTNRTGVPTRTNRQTGIRQCAYVVTGDAPAGSSMPAASPLRVSGTHGYTVAVSNNQVADLRSMTATTRQMWFSGPLSGQGALHIAANLTKPMGGITDTTNLNGTFYITATGGDAGYDTLLLVATDHPQPDDFALRIRTEFVRTS
ncbi:hypothetical protein [Methanoregula formicica]|uniref:Uncharacterized protein n=1 Tax=Methanoregula formicica (strain DSM 22288 / NBRC 105244 / SMSP) TaxID=593750 RepID=L0HFD3_METFS|nr:hypothetical protein [Methanoregula formicica]AGB01789.1 hypothetical protein Metfor_0729 [Methanoregula formicica SMSP]